MATRYVKGQPRTESPRAKDLPLCLVQTAYQTAGERTDGRDEQGRAAPGNRLAIGAGFKAQIRRSLGDPDDPAIGHLVREAVKMYNALLRDLPYDGPQVRPLVAAQTRHAVLGTHYANGAARVGLETAEGMALADKAAHHDGLAARLSTTAFDRAVKMAAAKKSATKSPVLAAIEARAREAAK
jgi:hypothetical protein